MLLALWIRKVVLKQAAEFWHEVTIHRSVYAIRLLLKWSIRNSFEILNSLNVILRIISIYLEACQYVIVNSIISALLYQYRTIVTDKKNRRNIRSACVKLKLSLCAMKTYWGSGGIAVRVLDLGTRWWWMVNFTTRPLCPLCKVPPVDEVKKIM
jgi:hypothetical protein